MPCGSVRISANHCPITKLFSRHGSIKRRNSNDDDDDDNKHAQQTEVGFCLFGTTSVTKCTFVPINKYTNDFPS